MTKEYFLHHKQQLITWVHEFRVKAVLTKMESEELQRLLEVLDEYTFENRFEQKRKLSRMIVDSLSFENIFAEKFLEFDRQFC